MGSRRTVPDFYRGGSPSTPYYTAHPSPAATPEPHSDDEQQPIAATLGHSRPPSPAPTADFSMISPPSSPSYIQYHSQFLSAQQGRNTLPFFRTSPTRTSTHLRSHSIASGGSTKRRVRPNITKLWESISSPSPRGSKSSPILKHPSPIHRHFPRSSPNILRAKRKTKRPSVSGVFYCGSRVQGNTNGDVHVDYGALDPLDGEEGELVDHEGYFDAIQCDLTELILHIFSLLPMRSVLACMLVSHSFYTLAKDTSVWLGVWKGREDEGVYGFSLLEDSEDVEGDGPSGWAVDWDRVKALRHSRRSRGIFIDEGINANRPSIYIPYADPILRRGTNLGPLRLNWHTLYRSRATLERRWRDPRGEPRVMRIEGHGDSVYCLDFDSRRIITGSRDRTIKVWCIRTGECLATFEAHLGSVLCLKFEKDFDAKRSYSRRSFSRGPINSEEEEGGANEDANEGEEEESHGMMVSGSSDCTVRVWDLYSKHRGSGIRADVRAILRGHSGGVLDLRMDENWIVSCSKDALINVYSRSTLTLHAVLRGHEGPVNAIGLEGGRVVSASGDGRMMLWDAASGRCERVFEGHERGLACIEFKDDLILSGSNDCTIKLWRASTGECLHTFAGHTLLVRALCFDPKTGYVVSASYDRSVRVWEWREPARGVGKLVREFRDLHASHIFDVKFDVGRIVSTSHDQKIVVLDFTDGIEGSEIFV
ncbi:WD40 repeat-like protein [Suillus fuscotomentosus]|uniref:WD40 repeat-like protein n=1 Tax=Suillus fuscotomentosus TaxID=1912939 RepID=A0AAD4ECD6_9AGAM|nr:WD40 repeat-like protein [Suillus fuscotomentosus]KAG1903653.1 WD40 repeat-like protein [Suillus fuscotomentosus]